MNKSTRHFVFVFIEQYYVHIYGYRESIAKWSGSLRTMIGYGIASCKYILLFKSSFSLVHFVKSRKEGRKIGERGEGLILLSETDIKINIRYDEKTANASRRKLITPIPLRVTTVFANSYSSLLLCFSRLPYHARKHLRTFPLKRLYFKCHKGEI